MPKTKVSLSEHLKGFSAVTADTERATSALNESLLKVGPVDQVSFSNYHEALHYLVPLKSFTTRFVLLKYANCTIILNDMRGEIGYVDAYAVSRLTRCDAVGISLLDERREFHLFKEGNRVRQIQSLCDGDQWYFREEGSRQGFEDLNEYTRKRKRDRFSVAAAKRYFEAFMGSKIPDWKNGQFGFAFGLERSTKDLQVPVLNFTTQIDL